MKMRVISLVTLIGLLFVVTACGSLGGVTDCGEDMQCFNEKAENCEPAKVLFNLELEMMGVAITSTSYQEILGEVDGLCEFKFRSEGVTVEFTQDMIDQLTATGMTQEQIDQQKATVEEQANQEEVDQICRVETAVLANTIGEWAEGSFTMDDWQALDCEDAVAEE